MMTFDPMTSEIRAEMDAFHADRKPASANPVRDIKPAAPAFLFADSPKVKAIKVAGLLKAREDVRDEILANGVTADRIAALAKYTDQLIGLGWTPAL
jgi:hypothetical protein